MSKTYTQIKGLEQLRYQNLTRQGSIVFKNKGPVFPTPENTCQRAGKTLIAEIATTIIAVVSLALIAISINSYMAVKTLLSQDIQNAKRMNQMEKSLDANADDIKIFSSTTAQIKGELKTLNSRIKNQTLLIEELKSQSEGQDRVLAGVIKVKNDLLARVRQLEEQSAASHKPLQ